MLVQMSDYQVGGLALEKGRDADSPERIREVATEFESLLVAQMLKSMRESSDGGWLGDSDQAGSTMVDMAEAQLARTIAAQGGLGLRDFLVKGLSPAKSAEETVPSHR